MAGVSPPAVLADANALYSAALRDILIELALADVVRLHWSPAILDELARALESTRADMTADRIRSLRDAMVSALPNANVDIASDLVLTAALPDPDDVHVLAAAVQAGCSILLTFNIADFPAQQLALEGNVAAMHPDTFLISLLTTNAAPVITVVDAIRRRLGRPALSRDAYCHNLERSGLPQSAALLRVVLDD